MKDKKVAVIGRGVAGLSCAMHLLENGFAVTVFGLRDLPGMASKAATGVMAMKGLVLPEKPLFACKLRGHRHLPALLARLEEKTRLSIPHMFAGSYEVFANAEEYAYLRKRIYHRQFTGCFAVDRYFGEDLPKDISFLNAMRMAKDIAGGFFYRQDGWFEPQAYLQALEAYILMLGGELQEVRVERLAQVKKEKVLHTLQGSRGGFDEVVLACGAYTDELLRKSEFKTLSLLSQPGLSLRASIKAPLASRFVLKAGANSLAVYKESLAFGSLDLTKNREVSAAQLEDAKIKLLEKMGKTVGSSLLKNIIDTKFSLGVRVMAKDRQPIFGFWPHPHGPEGVWILSGFHKSGFYLADSFAESLVKTIKNQAYPAMMASFTTARLVR